MKIKGALTVFISALLLVLVVVFSMDISQQAKSLGELKAKQESTIENPESAIATINTHDGLTAASVQCNEVQNTHYSVRNFYLALKRATTRTETNRRRAGYYKREQPILYSAAPPLYIAIRILLI
jgi:hypothetical protein